MRILLVGQQLANVRTGVGTYLRSLVSGLLELGHELTLVLPESERAAGATYDVIPISGRPRPFTPVALLAHALGLRKALAHRALEYDVIHLVDAREAAAFPLVGLASTHPPVLGSAHDSYAVDWLDPSYPRELHRDRLLRGPYYAWLRRMERFAYRRLDRVIANSEHVRRRVVGGYGLENDRVHVVPYGLAVPRLPAPEALDGNPSLLFVGANYGRKGLGVLLEALARAGSRLGDAHLHVVGDDPAREAFVRDARTRGLARRVTFHGPLPNERVLAMMAGATIFVLPSLVEAFGLVYLEALHMGTPVVATSHGGLGERLVHGQDAWLVPPGDVDSLVRALRILAKDEILRNELVLHGRRRAHEATPRTAARRTETIYAAVSHD